MRLVVVEDVVAGMVGVVNLQLIGVERTLQQILTQRQHKSFPLSHHIFGMKLNEVEGSVTLERVLLNSFPDAEMEAGTPAEGTGSRRRTRAR